MRNVWKRVGLVLALASPNLILIAIALAIVTCILWPQYKVVKYDHGTELVMRVEAKTMDGRAIGIGYIVESGYEVDIRNNGDKELFILLLLDNGFKVRHVVVPLPAKTKVSCTANPKSCSEVEIRVLDEAQIETLEKEAERQFNPLPPAPPAGNNAGVLMI